MIELALRGSGSILARHGFDQGPKNSVYRFRGCKNRGNVRLNHHNATSPLELPCEAVWLRLAIVKAVLREHLWLLLICLFRRAGFLHNLDAPFLSPGEH